MGAPTPQHACLYFLTQLRKSGIPSEDIVRVYSSVVRPVLEYSCQVWHGGLTDMQSNLLESIQQRALKIAYPSLDYEQALSTANMVSLGDRRNQLCERLFVESQNPDHRLNCLLPAPRDIKYSQRTSVKFPLPKCCTKRYKDSFIPFCLFHFNH